MKPLNNDLNILISCHKNFYIPKNKYFIPIQVGAENAKIRFDMIKDNDGDNISTLNPFFCELTSQYWAWKNLDCEYYGFFHYRRYQMIINSFPNDRELVVYDNISDINLRECGLFDEEKMVEEIKKYDIVLPNKCKCNPYNHYKESDQHNIEDLDKVIEIIHKNYPEYDKYVEKALHGTYTYFWNIFIMKKQYFTEYCNWLFSILKEFHMNKNYDDCSLYERRTPGLLAERLLTVFILYLKDKYPSLKIKEVPTALFEQTESPYPIPQNKDCVAFACDYENVGGLDIALKSILDNSKSHNYDFVILDYNLSIHQKNLLRKRVEEDNGSTIYFVKITNYKFETNNIHNKNNNYPIFASYIATDLLKNYDRVLFLNSNVLINEDIHGVFDLEMGDNYIAAVRDIHNIFQEHRNKKSNKNYDLLNPSVILFNMEKMRNVISSASFYVVMKEKKYNASESEMLSEVFKGHIHYLDFKWNYEPEEDIAPADLNSVRAPYHYYLDYLNAVNSPIIINYSDSNPTYVDNLQTSDKYWNFARKSYFYESILSKYCAARNTIPARESLFKKIGKRVFPKNSKMGKLLRKILKKQ